MPGDFRIDAGIFSHPKFKLLLRRLGETAGLCLFRLWAFCTVNKPIGDLDGMTVEEIETAVDWNGEFGLFVKTLVELKWMDQGGDGALQVHDWADHNPWAVGTEERSDKARFSRLAQTNSKLHKELRKQGINKISSKEMAELTNRQRTASVALAPSPLLTISLPSPSPCLSDSLPDPEEDSSSSSSEAEGGTRMTSQTFSDLYTQTFCGPLPEILKNAAASCCSNYTAEQIREAFQLGAERGAKSLSYITAVLEDKARPPVALGRPTLSEQTAVPQAPQIEIGSRWRGVKLGRIYQVNGRYGAFVDLTDLDPEFPDSFTVEKTILLCPDKFEPVYDQDTTA